MTKPEIAALLNRILAAESATSQAEEKCENAAHALHLAKAELAKNRHELVALSSALSAAWVTAS